MDSSSAQDEANDNPPKGRTSATRSLPKLTGVTALVSRPGGIVGPGTLSISAATLALWGMRKEMMQKCGFLAPLEPLRIEVTVPIRFTMPKTMPGGEVVTEVGRDV
jgi:hypothetical protein